MRILVTASCSEGLVLPLVPISWALRSAGHEVLVTAPANMAGVITDAGLAFAECHPPVEMPEVLSYDRAGHPVPMPRGEENLLPHIGRGYARLAVRLLDGVRTLAERWRPDLIVTETYGFVGPLVAAGLSVPWIEQGMRLSSPPSITRAGVEELRPELRASGRTDLPPAMLALDLCPAGLRPQDRPGSLRMRFVPYNGRMENLPDWVLEKRERPRVCLTFGTRVPLNRSPIRGGFSLLEELMRRLPEIGAEVVVGASDAVVRDLGALPAGVRAAGHLPMGQILPSCDLIVHHGGVGTTLSALTAGVPQVAVPVIAEVWESARLLAAAGAARQVPFAEASADSVVQAAATVLKDPSYAERAEQLRAEIAELPSPAEAVRTIERLVAAG
ncbi:nucleotide disphospho-sugar-binding domain-containing protein [Streptomyces humidus]|uniref:nucleotide disphospho-sugar-binding domain-containing protein n=1 Tax=Streptomyces humidus TaxID=52259 RepID=UPI00167D5605|nr:nucleotide disphospho-sugar-binding domain-containing protein [Streptomyces humidus]